MEARLKETKKGWDHLLGPVTAGDSAHSRSAEVRVTVKAMVFSKRCSQSLTTSREGAEERSPLPTLLLVSVSPSAQFS